ncbi:MAG TPA: hypothetical protein PLW93_01755 [Candidatus Absconditabacterales bacterium]|nr:hypothetical protein [Candidatus Absconditabacterales bacterium]HNG96975.1 hypothetical protein [Candidatus Absconditabacterales bacterium]
MFKAKIVLNKNGKQTVLEFDNENDYYEYLESHPEINQSFDWTNNWPAFGWNPWSRSDDLFKTSPWFGLTSKQAEKDLNPLALVKHDMRRIDQEERKQELEAKEQARKKEQQKKELEEAQSLLKIYKSKPNHDHDYAQKLEAYIENLEKKGA